MSYRDMQVLVALKQLRVTGFVEIDDSDMSDLTGLKSQNLWATYRSLESQGLIEYNPQIQRVRKSCWVSLTKKGRETAVQALRATLTSKTVEDTTLTTKTSREQV